MLIIYFFSVRPVVSVCGQARTCVDIAYPDMLRGEFIMLLDEAVLMRETKEKSDGRMGGGRREEDY